MDKATIYCPHCGRRLNCPPAALGRKLKCPACDGTFVAPAQSEEGYELVPDANQAATQESEGLPSGEDASSVTPQHAKSHDLVEGGVELDRMPRSVWGAVLTIFINMPLALLVKEADYPNVVVVPWLIIQAIVLFGLFKRSRLARRYAVILLGILPAIFVVLWSPNTFPNILRALDRGHWGSALRMLWGSSAPVIILVSLNLSSALSYFGLVCPACQCTRVRAADFLCRTAKCKSCGEVF